MPDVQSCGVQVDVVVGQHEAHAFVFGQRFAKRVAAAGVVQRHVVSPACLTEPAHAVCQACRCQSHLGITKALAHLAQHIAGGHAQVVKAQHAVATREAAVHRVHVAFQPNARFVHVCQKHGGRAVFHACHDDGVVGSVGPGDEPFDAVDQVIVAVVHRSGFEHRRVCTRTRVGFGHGKARARQARHLRAQPALFLGRCGHLFHEVDVAFVGRVDVECRRSQVGVPGFFKHHCFGDVAQAQPTHLDRGVGREQARSACAGRQLSAQVFRRAVGSVARVALEGDHLFGNELPCALAQRRNVGWDVKVHGACVFGKW